MRVHDDWLLTPQRAAVHLPTATAVVADLHLGYAEARRARGEAVPVVPLDEALAPLAQLAATAEVRRLVIAGDLFEDGCCEQLVTDFLAWAEGVGLEVVGVVPGNHDRRLERSGGRLPLRLKGVVLGQWRVVHGDDELPEGAVAHGHFHPCLRWGRGLTAACFLGAPGRLVLPAFSADARGVNVLREPRWADYRCYALAADRVHDLGPVSALLRGVKAGVIS
jgi:metallophosphoesterase superfamily enzyme